MIHEMIKLVSSVSVSHFVMQLLSEVRLEHSHYGPLFLTPKSVAFVGVPRKSGPGALNPVDNLRIWGYQGTIQLVHPHVREIAGLPVVSKISSLNGPIDLAVISTPRQTIPEMIKECGKKGITAVIVTVQGFAEADSRGKKLQDEMLAEARKFGIRILGPNTLGITNAFHRFDSSFMPSLREELPIGLICQSGLFFVGVTQLIGGMGIGVDLGNACDVGITDALEWLGIDERLKVIGLHAEEIRGGQRFIEAAKKVSRRIPVITLKTGRSVAGAKASASHTGSMAGEDRIVDAAFKKAGIIRVDETEDQFDLIRGFARLPAMKGPRVAVVTLSGASGIIFLDTMDKYGLECPKLSAETMAGIQGLTPDWMRLGNPIDMWPAIMKHGIRKAFRTALKDTLSDPGVDGVICINLAMREPDQKHLGAEKVIQEFSERFDKPVVVWVYGSHPEPVIEDLETHGRALVTGSLERSVRILAAMARYEQWKRSQV